MPYLLYKKDTTSDSLDSIAVFYDSFKLITFLQRFLKIDNELAAEYCIVFDSSVNCNFELGPYLIKSREEFSTKELSDFFRESVDNLHKQKQRALQKMRLKLEVFQNEFTASPSKNVLKIGDFEQI